MKAFTLCALLFALSFNDSLAQTWNSDYFPPVGYYTPCDSIFIFYADDTSNIWQEGSSSIKTFFGLNGAENAIMTDSLNAYSTSNHSYFDLMLPFDGFNNYGCINEEVRFLHKMETDDGKDGGYITWSPDHGITWYSMFSNSYGYVSYLKYQNLYFPNDTIIASNGYAAFTGVIDTFLETRLQFIRHGPERMEGQEKLEDIGDTILVRFHFVSDSIQTNKAGWIIKDLQVLGLELGGFVSSTNQISSVISVSPNPSENGEFDFVTADNSAIETIRVFTVTGQLVCFFDHIQSQNFKLQLKSPADGIYFYSVKLSNGGVTNGKLLK